MKGLVFLDTETTGNNLLSDRLFQVCYLVDGKTQAQYFKPSLPISVKAQSITHVTNKMIESCEPFADSKMKIDLQKLLKDKVLVAHNAVFDICMLSKEGIDVPKFICTLKVSRFLDEEELVPEHNLQFLRYFHEIEVKANAHDAEGDVLVLEAVFKNLFDRMMEKYQNEEEVIAKMIEISLQPSIFRTFTFGKYKGQKIEEIAKTDKNYLEWLLNEKSQGNNSDEDWIFTLKHYLNIK